ncbi:unnamed protein product [Miscanthus lutarioriparius]|uniref:GAG-pre-integrase domain-containing protein n=1 Tax=Miscanthus lutarioriparius TaxID=422564 RepID=A0A811RMZ1_9POAL|nr:unnamed protein product [Miscanthus lutarioriparius]
MAESGRIEHMFEKLAEILTVKELVKLAQLFLARTSELMSATEESNVKEKMEQLQGSSRGSEFPKENKKATMLGNLINLARPDKGASRHVTGASSEFESYSAYPSTHSETIQTADGTCQPIKGVGSVSFDRENCIIEDKKTGKELGIGIRYGGLWFLDRKKDDKFLGTALTASMNEDEAKVMLQHCRLGHLSFDTMVKVFPEMMRKVDRRKLVCDACEYGKHTRSTYERMNLLFHQRYLDALALSGIIGLRAVKCIFVGYSSSRKGYTCWCPTERRLFVSMDVTFRESEPYYGEKTDLSSLFELNGQSSEDGQEGEDDIDVPQDKEENQSRGSETITGLIPYNVGNAQVNERQENMGNINIHARQEQGTLRVYTRRKKTVEVQPVHQQVEQPQLVEQQEEQPECLDVDVTGTEVDRSIETGGEEVERSTETGGEEVEPSINLPIALRKEARSTARKPPTRYGFQHDISNYVSYESLSPTYRAFIASLQSTKIPKDWKEAKLDPKWLYVDDIIITGDDTLEIARLKENLSKEFEVKDLGQLRYFLGIEIARSARGIVLSQRKYVLDLLNDTVYRILRYLKSSPGKGLWFKKNNHLNVEGYCDADWASCLDDRRSTFGYCIFVGGNLVSWRSKKQPVVSRSTAEAEYRAMSVCLSEMLWVTNLLSELKLGKDHP